jgi:hypothetical protein
VEEEFSIGNMLMLEYKHLKHEQLARIGTRDNLIYVTLASLAAVAAATLQIGMSRLLLLLPPACLILGWTYLVNDQKVSAIGSYIRTVLVPQIRAEIGTDEPLFSWEVQHRGDSRRRFRKAIQLCIDLITFCAPAVAAVIVYSLAQPLETVFVVISAVELVSTLLLGWAIVDSADLSRDPLVWRSPAIRQHGDESSRLHH